ncbi:glutamate synthase (NADPH/NADH) small chain [Anaerocolumna jejuensis DSM 15929]|uniref:Glutamate synthase (NADPH/NADH) small chain n=1 Tax=Anaerocolumna jejuensis DSM 15929 TaxID=1121322 RepID=A0A1M6LU49_9FIRM|nr:NAD(P)-dependent oxidoreductase [Anaerocolumna jejuensis]SHJ74777.1 glutamate synthase (NADPH/NADH) small chain [Anaerocolumna jejuensis DSM 15929]
MSDIVISEAKRCLQCKKPLCKSGCPVNTPFNEVIPLLLEGSIVEAGEMLFDNNPLSVICSLVCPHEKQCEGHCVLGKKGDPIKVGMVENYISDYYLNYVDTYPRKGTGKRVAIVGSGPAGITIAILLAAKGYNITIFEAHDKIGGVLRFGIPEFRLPKALLDKLKDKLIEMGIKIRPNTLIGPIITVDDLFRDGYKAVFIGTGVWNPNTLKLKGETLGHVHYAIDYLKSPEVYTLGKKVCIIGAGNVAMDVARTALRNGSRDVTIMYRKGAGSIDAEPVEVEYAKLDGVKFNFYQSPLEIIDEGVRYQQTYAAGTDENGREIVDILEGAEGLFECDSVILAVGQKPRRNIVNNSKGIDINNRGLLVTDEFGRTTKEGVFASGDVVTGAKTVVEAVRVSKVVAKAIEEYLEHS